jgi:hypothetical protein
MVGLPLRWLVGAVGLAFVMAVGAGAVEGEGLSIPLGPTGLPPCSGDPIVADQVIEGWFPTWLTGSYVMVPFEVPAGTTSVRVKYCWEGGGHTVDLGLWQSREGDEPWGPAQFRGWGGSSHPDVTVTPQGFSTEAEYLAHPKGHVPGRTTRGFLPGPIPPGEWALELGVAYVVPEPGDADGQAAWRVELELSDDPAFAAEPYAPAPYDSTPARIGPDWYAGDMHVHGEHSALGDATMSEVFEFAFRQLEMGGAGLDFLTLSDYVTRSAWDEIGRYQGLYPGKLIIRSTEVITYQGHLNNHASLRYVDHRTGPVYELAPDGTLTLLRAERIPAEMFAEIHEAGGFTQINHPRACPSSWAGCPQICRGCPWDFTSIQTDYSQVDAIEIQTAGRFAYLLFTPLAIQFWQDALAHGHKIAAVGSSDSHKAGLGGSDDRSPIGTPTTMVYAAELSETGIRDGVKAGHTYVKLFGNAGPDVRFEATGEVGEHAIMGDELPGPTAMLSASALNVPFGEADPHVLRLFRNGQPVSETAVDPPGGDYDLGEVGPGRYHIQLERGDLILDFTSAIYVPEAGATGGGLAALAALAALRRSQRSRGRRWPGPSARA